MPITINTWPSKDGLRIEYLHINHAINKLTEFRVQDCVKVEVAVLGFPSNEPDGFRGRKAILNRASALVTTCP